METKKYTITRAKYKQIKKLDHAQMESFCQTIYDRGYADGFLNGVATGEAETKKQIGTQLLEVNESMKNAVFDAIQDTKGIGPAKFQELKKNLLPIFGITAQAVNDTEKEAAL